LANHPVARLGAGNRLLVEEPSAAELAVLRCLAAGLSRREIGAQLYISLNTVKTHTRELYRKLGVTSRADAVARAEALGLLDPTESPG
jgi:ATP/maltotriose-dependent transcriptional regulator MalT